MFRYDGYAHLVSDLDKVLLPQINAVHLNAAIQWLTSVLGIFFIKREGQKLKQRILIYFSRLFLCFSFFFREAN